MYLKIQKAEGATLSISLNTLCRRKERCKQNALDKSVHNHVHNDIFFPTTPPTSCFRISVSLPSVQKAICKPQIPHRRSRCKTRNNLDMVICYRQHGENKLRVSQAPEQSDGALRESTLGRSNFVVIYFVRWSGCFP
jgi:hypothetical protein